MKKVHKKLLVLTIIVVNCIGMMAWFGAESSNAEISNNVKTKDRLEAIKEKGVLTVASANDVPFAYIDPKTKEFTGIDAEIIREVAKRLGINKVEMRLEVPFENLLQQLNTNEDIDIVADGMYVTDERKKEALFTNILYKESEAIIIPKVSKIAFKEDFKNAVIGVQIGTAFLELAQKWQKDNLVKDVVIFRNQAELLSAVNTGKIDAAITDYIVAAYILSKDSNFYLKILEPYEPEEPGMVAAAVRKSDTTLVNAMNQQIDEMKRDKTILKIIKKYGLNEKNFVSVNEGHISG